MRNVPTPDRAAALPTVGLALGLALVLGACSEPAGPGPEALDLRPLKQEVPTPIVPGQISVCKEGPAGTYTFEGTVTDGSGSLSSPLDVDAGSCAVIFTTVQDQPVSDVTVVETGIPEGVEFEKVVVFADLSGTVTETTYTENSAPASANTYHGSVVVFYNVELPPPPPEICVGLTPGYWKNWKNHYAMEEFASLLAETNFSDLTVEEATAVLKKGGKDPLDKLMKFMLANELTLALTETELPNPDGAALSAGCVDPEGDMELGAALEAAWAIVLADGEGYSKHDILMYKDILDRIANMDSTESE
ncbi:MAG: hypothetical protein PVI57_23980 [Gemmatimonadota bacterium]|jgi:hypothetical protein